jgi:hypothetical protein
MNDLPPEADTTKINTDDYDDQTPPMYPAGHQVQVLMKEINELKKENNDLKSRMVQLEGSVEDVRMRAYENGKRDGVDSTKVDVVWEVLAIISTDDTTFRGVRINVSLRFDKEMLSRMGLGSRDSAIDYIARHVAEAQTKYMQEINQQQVRRLSEQLNPCKANDHLL